MSIAGPSTSVSVIVPTLNECGNLGPLVAGICSALEGLEGGFEILIADGGSTDGTREEAQALAGAGAPLRLLDARTGRGLAGDVLFAAQEARSEVVIVMDADGSHDPADLPRLAAPVLAGARDLVIGSRYVQGGQTVGWPLLRRFISKAAAALAKPWVEVQDPTSGFFAVRRERLVTVDPRADGFKIGLEILLSGQADLRVEEVPVVFTDRTRGQSKMSAGQAMHYVRRLAALTGGDATPTAAGRFLLVGLLGMLVDLGLFQALWSAGLGLGVAHISGFAAASLFNYVLNARWSFRASTQGRLGGAGYARFLGVALLALFLRGGVLAFCHDLWGFPALAAAAVAILATALVNYLGSAFFVFHDERAISSEYRWRTASVGITAYILVLRLVYLGLVDLMPEEAYYWNYAQHPALGYLDHPPMVAWLIHLGTGFFGRTEFGVRIGAYVCWLVAAGFTYGFAHNLRGKSAALKSLLLLAVLPFFFTAGFIMTPDAPLTACWAGTLFFMERALLGGQRKAWWGAGLFLGLGLLSKYTILLLGPAALLFMLVDRPSRRWLRSLEPYGATLLAGLMFTPVVLWNARHHWASFTFQTMHRMEMKARFSPHMLLASILILLTPVVAFAAYRTLISSWCIPFLRKAAFPTREQGFMLSFTLVPLSVFFLFSLTHEPKLEWTGPIWIAVLPAIAGLLGANAPVAGDHRKTTRGHAWVPTFMTTLLLLGGLLHYLTLGLPGVPYAKRMALPVAWQELGGDLQSIASRLDQVPDPAGNVLVVGMDKYSIASEAAFYAGGEAAPRVETGSRNLFGQNALMYNFWLPADRVHGRRILLVSFRPQDLVDARLAPWVEEVGPLEQKVVQKDGQNVSCFFYRLARYTGDLPQPGVLVKE